MASFRFCETYLLHIKPFVVSKSAISQFLGGQLPGGWLELNMMGRSIVMGRRALVATVATHVGLSVARFSVTVYA